MLPVRSETEAKNHPTDTRTLAVTVIHSQRENQRFPGQEKLAQQHVYIPWTPAPPEQVI